MAEHAESEPDRVAYPRTLAGALGISTAPILFTLSAVHPTVGAVWRFLYSLPLLVPLCLLRSRGRASFRQRRWQGWAALSGLFFAADLALWHHSIDRIGAGTATLLVNTQTIWVAGIGRLFLHERPSRAFWLALPAMGAGLFLLAGGNLQRSPEEVDRVGLACGLAAGLAYALMLVFLRRAQLRAAVQPESALLVQIGVALATLAALGWAEGSLATSLTLEQHVWLLLLGVGVQAVSWILITGGIGRLPGHHGAALLLVQPVSSLILGWWILDQALSPERAIGAVLLLVAIAVPLLQEGRRRR